MWAAIFLSESSSPGLRYNKRMPVPLPFTDALFQWMRESIPRAQPSIQQELRAYLKAPDKKSVASAMQALIDADPLMAKQFDSQPFDTMRLTLGPLFFWGLTQPWASECNVAKCFKQWATRLNGGTKSQSVSAAIMGLGVTSLLKDPALNLDATKRVQLNYHLYCTVSRLVPWDTLAEQGSGQDFVVGPLGVLAAQCPKEKIQGTLIWTHWTQNLRKSLEKMPPADQTVLARQLLGMPDLPNSAKRAALKEMLPQVWLDPTVKEHLLPLLPQDEDKRRKMLPWAPNFPKNPLPGKRQRPGPINRSLHEQYCPSMSIGLHLLDLSLVDWEDRTYIDFCIKEVAPNEKSHLDLPDGFVVDP